MLRKSYDTLKVGTAIAAPPNLQLIVTNFDSTFKLTLQLSAALVVFSITVNLAFGFLNKMIPQIPIYFVSTPFVVLGGLFILLQNHADIIDSKPAWRPLVGGRVQRCWFSAVRRQGRARAAVRPDTGPSSRRRLAGWVASSTGGTALSCG